MTTYLVEGYWPGIGERDVLDGGKRLAASVRELRHEGVEVTVVSTTVVPADEAAYWVVDGPSAEAVAGAYRRAAVAVDRIVEALEPGRRRRTARAGP